MSSADTTPAPRSQGLAFLGLNLSWLLLAWVLALAAWVRMGQLQSSDVGWLLSTAEWMLDGRRASVDFFEVNPPGSTLIYVPAVMLGRLIRLSPDLMNQLLVFALAMAVAWLAASRFAPAIAEKDARLKFMAGLLVVFLILPSHAFTQREHIGSLCLMPWLAIAATRERPASVLLRLAAGVGFGCAGIAKPHLVLIPLAVLAFEFFRVRSLKAFAHEVFCVENIAAGLVLLTYAAAIVFVFPEFLSTVLPRVVDVYLPVRKNIFYLLCYAGVWICLLLCVLSFALKKAAPVLSRSADVFMVASIGGVFIYVIQAKGLYYHIYPAVAFGSITFMLRLAGGAYESQKPIVRLCLSALAVFCVFLGYIYFDTRNSAEIRATVHEIEKIDPSPRILMISGDLETGFPVTRLTHGTWVQRQPFLWMAYGAYKIAYDTAPNATQREMLNRYIALERKILAEDIINGKPTIILIEGNRAFDWKNWAEEDLKISNLLKEYRVASVSDWVTILQKR